MYIRNGINDWMIKIMEIFFVFVIVGIVIGIDNNECCVVGLVENV